jgi:bis(5'-nucleosyl)-tetraphosphatase (symmetrical)
MILLVGDIQGCDAALGQLLAEAGFTPSRDRLIVLGDLVNRGPQSLAVLQRMAALGDSASCLLGNHDLHLLAAAHGVRPVHADDTLDEILNSPDRDAWLDWLRQRPLALQVEGWLCVHAGVPPSWTAGQTLSRGAEVQQRLSGPDPRGFLMQMYGNQPTRWRDDLAGADRLRFIVNALTRMRFVSPDGELDFKVKDGAQAAPPGLLPWFDVPGRQTAGTPLAFGHWSTLGLVNRADLLALDTGCVWGGQLTAARIDGGRRELFQVSCARERQPGR